MITVAWRRNYLFSQRNIVHNNFEKVDGDADDLDATITNTSATQSATHNSIHDGVEYVDSSESEAEADKTDIDRPNSFH